FGSARKMPVRPTSKNMSNPRKASRESRRFCGKSVWLFLRMHNIVGINPDFQYFEPQIVNNPVYFPKNKRSGLAGHFHVLLCSYLSNKFSDKPGLPFGIYTWG